MAHMNPEYTSEQLEAIESAGEAKVYRAFRDQLSNDWHVYHSITWIVRKQEDEARDGEIDFVVCHPEYGFLSIEVKGGGVGFDAHSGNWFSIDRNRKKHILKNPVNQAKRAKYSILGKLQEHPKWSSLSAHRVMCGHAVLFPDLEESQRPERPDLPRQIVGVDSALSSPEAWLMTVNSYWRGEDGSQEPINRAGIALFDSVFARSFEALPLLARALESEEAQRITLTQQQARVLDLLSSRRRVAISGGAGTGKTVLAVEKARRLANEGFHTLLTCYNRPLADHLAQVCAGTPNLEVMSFHQLCAQRVQLAQRKSGRDLLGEAQASYPGRDHWDVHYPNALSYSIDILDAQFDAIVCDEGQDFGEDFWVPIELFLTDLDSSPLYIFYDENQDLYSRASSFPIQNEPFTLTVNCRNTDVIHMASYRYYKGQPIEPPEIKGRDTEIISAASLDAQTVRLHARIADLIHKERVKPEDIVVLIASAYHKNQFYESLRHRPLPGRANWLEESEITSGRVLLETVNRFKGLEAPIVFLWGIDGLDLLRETETLYVGLSRPKSMLILVGQSKTCESILFESSSEG